jgi:uncharacterized protein
MNLTETIKKDIITAMKGKDAETLTILRTLSASLKNKGIELKRELEDTDVVSVVRSDVKKMKDALSEFKSAAREDLAEKAQIEIDILNKYLPADMPVEELRKIVKEKLKDISATSLDDMGKAMGAAMGALKGRVEGGRVKAMVEEVLKEGL